MCKFKRAEQCLEIDEVLAVNNIAEGLNGLSHCEADRLLNSMKRTLSPKMYCLVYKKYMELRNV